MNYVPYAVILAVLVVIIFGLLAYRKKLTSWEDDTLHIQDEGQEAKRQQDLDKRLSRVDLIGKILTAIVVIGAIVLVVVYAYLTQFADKGVKMG